MGPTWGTHQGFPKKLVLSLGPYCFSLPSPPERGLQPHLHLDLHLEHQVLGAVSGDYFLGCERADSPTYAEGPQRENQGLCRFSLGAQKPFSIHSSRLLQRPHGLQRRLRRCFRPCQAHHSVLIPMSQSSGGQETIGNEGWKGLRGHLDSTTSLSHFIDEDTEGRTCPRSWSSVMEPGQQPGVLTLHRVLLPYQTHTLPPRDQHVSQQTQGVLLPSLGDMPERSSIGWRMKQLSSAFQMKTSGEGDRKCSRWSKP